MKKYILILAILLISGCTQAVQQPEESLGALGGSDMVYGSEQVFSSDICNWVRVAEIDTNIFVTCAVKGTATAELDCTAAEVSNTTITYGTEFEIDFDVYVGGLEIFGLCKLDTGKFAVAYADDGSGDDGYVRVCDADGDETITCGTPYEFANTDVEWIDCTAVDSDTFVVVFNDETGGDDGSAVACDYSNQTVSSCGSASDFDSGESRYIKIAQLGTDKFVVVYEDEGATGAYARVNTTSGTTLGSWGTTYTLDTNDVYYTDVGQVTTDTFVAVWSGGTNYQGQARACTSIGGTTITCDTTQTYGGSTSGVTTKGVYALSTTKFILSYKDSEDSNQGLSVVNDLSGTAITMGTAEYFAEAATAYIDIDEISSNKIVTCYLDDDNSDYGTCIIGDYQGGATPPAGGGGDNKQDVIWFK